MDSTPGLEVYESYETDYKTLAASIGDKLKGEARETKGGEWEQCLMLYTCSETLISSVIL